MKLSAAKSAKHGQDVRALHVLLVGVILTGSCFAQVSFLTGRSDNQRTAANRNETLLTPGNVSNNTFGSLFNYPLDYQALAQPLYVPNVQIPGRGTHNVVYVATMADSVYAFDADSNQGANAAPLWWVNFTNPAAGITTASVATGTLPCATTENRGPGITQEGIVSTPVIDPDSGTMYVVAKTLENGTVRHRLHALDITTGAEKFGGPTLITATSISNKGKQVTFNSLHEKNRPGLLLLNGAVYMAFGSNYCNDNSFPWLLAYDATSLQQVGSFNASPDHGLASIWQTGEGISADAAGNIYVTTSEGKYDVPTGGQGYANSVLKLSTNPLALADYFTPWNVSFLDSHDVDVSSNGCIMLPDQEGAVPHILVAVGKEGTIYVLNRDQFATPPDNHYNPNGDSQIVQELPFAVGAMFDSPTYWNGMLYFAGNADQIKGFSVANGQLSPLPIVATTQKYPGAHSPSISANGNTDGILWVMSGGRLYAFDAQSLSQIYSTSTTGLPKTSHFATQTVANGKVYIATRTTLEAYGLFSTINVISGDNQSGTVLTTLANPIQLQAADPYTGAPIVGATITLSDGGKGGVFSPSRAITDDSGSTPPISYTLPKTSGTYTLTASSPGLASAFVTATALPAAPVKLTINGGNHQVGTVGTVLPVGLLVKALDPYRNGVPGVSVTFSDQGKGGAFSCNPCVTNAKGLATAQYQLPPVPGTYKVDASAQGLKTLHFMETAAIGSASSITATGGNNQTAPAGTQLPQALTALVTDQQGNPVAGVAVTFDDGGAGGSFSNSNPVTTDNTGTAAQLYTLPVAAKVVNITANAAGVSTPATFTETGSAGPPAGITPTGGNNQTGTAGTQLPQPLTALVTDTYGNPVNGVAVAFSDGGAGGVFFYSNPVTTDNTGTAAQVYTLPPALGTFTITATAAGVGTPAMFTETAE